MKGKLLKGFFNKKNGQISVHPKRKTFSKKELELIKSGKLMFKIQKVKI